MKAWRSCGEPRMHGVAGEDFSILVRRRRFRLYRGRIVLLH